MNTRGERPQGEERRWRNQTLVRERDPHRLRMLGRMLLLAAIALAPVGALLVQQNRYLELTVEVEELRREQEQLRKEELRLRLERATLESLSGIESWAADQQDLERPAPEDLVIVPPPGPTGPDRLIAAGDRPGS